MQEFRLLTVRLDGTTLHALLPYENMMGEERNQALAEDFRRLPDFMASVVRLDMSSVGFGDAMFFARLIHLWRSLKAVGATLVVVTSPKLGEVFRMIRFDQVFEVIIGTGDPRAATAYQEEL